MTGLQELSSSPLFHTLAPNDITAFLTCVQPQALHLPKGTTLIDVDDPITHVVLITKGRILLFHDECSGHISMVEKLYPGDLYGQEAVFTSTPLSPVRLTAGEDSDLLLFNPRVFYQHCAFSCSIHQTVARNMLHILSQRLVRLTQKVTYLSCSSLKSKVALYLLHEGKKVSPGQAFTIPFNREDLAAYLNTQRPSLSRILTQLRKEGKIDYKRSTFRILDEKGLRDIE